MKFAIEKGSPVPVHTQIKERIKTALSLGELRPGDTLPSIRDLEQQLGVGRAIVRRAYLDLQESGILEIRPGRRVCVNAYLRLRTGETVIRRLETLVDKTLDEVRKLNVSNSSFAKLLLLRAIERDRSRLSYLLVDTSEALAQRMAAQISHLWEVPIHAASIDALPELLKLENHSIHKIIVNYYRYDEVTDLLKNMPKCKHAEVVPISLRFTAAMIAEIKKLPARSTVLLVAEDREFRRHGQAFAETYKQAFPDLPIQFAVRSLSSIKDVDELARSNKYALILMSNSIWDRLPAEVRRIKGVSHPRVEVDRTSLEEARTTAGIIA